MESSATAVPKPARRCRWCRWLAGSAALLVVLVAMMLSRAPDTAPAPPPESAEVAAARDFYRAVRDTRDKGPTTLRASWQELAAVAKLAGRAGGIDRVAVWRDGDRGALSASMALGLGFWLNGKLWVGANDYGEPRVSARVGRLPVPPVLVHAGLSSGRLVLRTLGADIPPLDEMVQAVQVGERGIGATVALSSRTGIVRAVVGLRSSALDQTRTANHYCRLVAQQAAAPDSSLAGQVRRAFRGADGSVDDNRAAIVALSLLIAGREFEALKGTKDALFARCPRPESAYELQGRHDLALHWVVSAALATLFGTQASISVGTWKEISDSGAGGSGFSLVDLSADRSGVYCAEKSTQAPLSGAVRDWLAGVSEEDLLPVTALALAEGMSEQEFRGHFTSTESDTFADTVARIDQSLAVLINFQSAR